MSELEKKFKEFLIKHKQVSNSTITIGEAKALAHDLVEIAEKENKRLRNAIKEYLDKNIATDEKLEELQHKVRKAIRQDENLIKENTKLKKQIENIKYLDRKKVNSILWDYINDVCYENDDIVLKNPNHVLYENRLCNFAIPTKQKVIEVLESPLGKDYKAENNIILLKRLREQIASEILGDDNEKPKRK